MPFDHLFRFVFVLYCTVVGLVLVLAPWTPGWDQLVLHLPEPGLRLMGSTVARGALSGFGLVHLVWGLHDLGRFLFPRSYDDEADSTPAGDH